MKIEQLYTSCLAQGAYFIESEGEAAVIDALREVQFYQDMAADANAKIKYIFETHFHADFVSGHLELYKASVAEIVFGPGANTAFTAYIGEDNEVFYVGKLKITLLHTPGHTLESCCYLLEDEYGVQQAIFTGDTLFIGDVGRPDLAQQPKDGLTQYDLAGMLYDSIRNRIMPLPDRITVYPAHGAGSACGKNMKETSDSLGNQKLNNYALDQAMSREQFIEVLIAGLGVAPAYFPMNVKMNIQGSEDMKGIFERGLRPISPLELTDLIEEYGLIVLDTRDTGAFAAGHIPGAVNIGLSGSFAPWVGALLPFENISIVLIADEGKQQEALIRLSRIGYDCVIGWLQGGMEFWIAGGYPTSNVTCIDSADFKALNFNSLNIIDVRNQNEFKSGHLDGAMHFPLADFHLLQQPSNAEEPYYVYCAGGYHSMIYISMLKGMRGINLININGGYSAIIS